MPWPMLGRCWAEWSQHSERMPPLDCSVQTEPKSRGGRPGPNLSAAKWDGASSILHDILTRILRVYGHEVAAMWLIGSEPLLGGARPIDVLVTEGAAPVIRAIDGIAAGAYA